MHTLWGVVSNTSGGGTVSAQPAPFHQSAPKWPWAWDTGIISSPDNILDFIEPCIGSGDEGDFVFSLVSSPIREPSTPSDECSQALYCEGDVSSFSYSSNMEFLKAASRSAMCASGVVPSESSAASHDDVCTPNSRVRRVTFRDTEFSRLVAERMFPYAQLPTVIEQETPLPEGIAVSQRGRVHRAVVYNTGRKHGQRGGNQEHRVQAGSSLSSPTANRNSDEVFDIENDDDNTGNKGIDDNDDDSGDQEWCAYGPRKIRTRSRTGVVLPSGNKETPVGSRSSGGGLLHAPISQPPGYVIGQNALHRQPRAVDRSAAKPGFYDKNELYRNRKRYSDETRHLLWNGLMEKMRDPTGWSSSRHADPTDPPPPKLHKLAVETGLSMACVKRYLHNAAKKGREWLENRNLQVSEKTTKRGGKRSAKKVFAASEEAGLAANDVEETRDAKKRRKADMLAERVGLCVESKV